MREQYVQLWWLLFLWLFKKTVELFLLILRKEIIFELAIERVQTELLSMHLSFISLKRLSYLHDFNITLAKSIHDRSFKCFFLSRHKGTMLHFNIFFLYRTADRGVRTIQMFNILIVIDHIKLTAQEYAVIRYTCDLRFI